MLGKLVLLTFSAFTLGSLGQIFRISGVNLYLFDLVVFGANLYLFLFFLKKKKLETNSPLILFIFFSIFSLVLSLFKINDFLTSEALFSLSFWVRFNMYFFFGFFVVNAVKHQFLSFETLKRIFIYNFYLLLALNFIQYIFLRDISFMESYGFDPHVSRLTGFFLDPNFMGFYLVLYLYLNNFYLKQKYFSFLTIFMIFLTESRSAFLVLGIYLTYYLFVNPKKTFIYILLSIFLFIFSSLPHRFEGISASNDSTSLRIESWDNALLTYKFNDYFGVGFNNYKYYAIALNVVPPQNYYLNSSNYSDSSFLSILVMTGISGLLIFLSFLGSYAFTKNNLIILFILAVNSFVINSLFFPPLCVFILLILNLNYLKINPSYK